MSNRYQDRAAEVLEALQNLSSSEHKKKMSRYFTTSQDYLGVNSPGLRILVKVMRKAHADWEPSEWIALSKELVKMGIFECQVTGFELLAIDRKLLAHMSAGDARELMVNLDNWASVDHFSVGIHGILWREGIIGDERIRELLRAENVWERRVAVVSTVALNTRSRGGYGDAHRTIWVCREVVDERHPMIWKALSWALRSLIRWDRDAVENFLEMYGERMSKQVLREVRHKLDHGTKN